MRAGGCWANVIPATLASAVDLAKLYQAERRYPRRRKSAHQGVGQRSRRTGRTPSGPDECALALLGEVRLRQLRYAEARPVLREALLGYEKTAPDSWPRFETQQSLLGRSLAGHKQYAAAEPLFLSGYDGLARLASTDSGSRPA